MSELRLYAITSKEVIGLMKGNRGKLVAQAGHAYLHAFWDACIVIPEVAEKYCNSQAAAKIALVVDTTKELEIIYNRFYVDHMYGLTKVVDSGRTCFNEPTFTFVGVGPITSEDFERIAPGLKVLL